MLNILKLYPIENDWIIKLEEIAWSCYPGIAERKLWIPYESIFCENILSYHNM
ncbi:MAG: hypothetical protein RMI30_05065 [Thermodesulfovibrio sp.]|nr:hypothetical protein [Thermodesulfovibrio sp.]